jgi:hypothetical protein
MDRKITDILPPKKRRFTKKIEGEIKEEKREIFPEKKEERQKKPSVPPKITGLISTLIILALGAGFSYFYLSQAIIDYWPETQTLKFETKVTVGDVIPGKVLEKEKTTTEVFSSSGRVQKENKAEGTIRVYNEYSTYDQPLIATTRFISSEGKVFRTPVRVTIPGGHYEKGKFVPGEIDIKVVADEPGPEYNIGPSTFSIPGFAGTARYTKFYAKSFQSMVGGFSEEVPQITEEDLESARNALSQKAKEEAEELLKNDLAEEVMSEFEFSDKSIKTEIMETFTLAKVGDETEEFNYQVKAKSETIVFKTKDLKDFAKEYILPQVPEGKKLHEESLKINYDPETIDLESGEMILSLNISVKVYSDVDVTVFKPGLKGKSQLEAKIFLEEQPGIDKVKVKFLPFWVAEVPDNTDKIKFNLNID